MEFCCTSSSSVPWWTTRALSRGLPLTPISGNCRCCSPSVFALLPVHLGMLVTGKFMRIWEFLSLPTTSYLWDIWLKVRWCGEPLHYAARHISTLPTCWPSSTKTVRIGSQTCLPTRKGSHVDTLNHAQLELFDYPDWGFSSVLRQMPGYNMQRRAQPALLSR